jgi:hypothetical protein
VAEVVLLTSTVKSTSPELAPPDIDEFDAVFTAVMSPARSVATHEPPLSA